jgi:hypothetical protein
MKRLCRGSSMSKNEKENGEHYCVTKGDEKLYRYS